MSTRSGDQPPRHTRTSRKRREKIILRPDADPHNADWLRTLETQREREEQASQTPDQQKEKPANGDIQ